MALLTFTLFCLTSVLLCQAVTDNLPCAPPAHTEGVESCSCQTDDGVIDLNPLARKDGSARFTGVMDSYGFNYTYNPCIPFEELARPCDDVYICQSLVSHGTSYAYVIGASNEQIYYSNKSQNYLITYRGTAARMAVVHLNCDQSTDGNFTFVKEGPGGSYPAVYIFQLSSCHACPGGCTKHLLSEPGLICTFILFLCLVVAFFMTVKLLVTGAVLVRVRSQAVGSDRVWVPLPALTKAARMEVDCTKVKVSDSHENKYRKEANQTYFDVKYDIPASCVSQVYLNCDQKNSEKNSGR